VNLKKTLEEILDSLAPRLDVSEFALYLHLFRHSHMKGRRSMVFRLGIERKRLPRGIKNRTQAMGLSTCRDRLYSLAAKGLIRMTNRSRTGALVEVRLPAEVPAPRAGADASAHADYYRDPEKRLAILQRESFQCFYCRRLLDFEGYVLDHAVPRPYGDNSFRNIVAACAQCNTRKHGTRAEVFLRELYRQGLLDSREFSRRLDALRRLKKGLLKPAA